MGSLRLMTGAIGSGKSRRVFREMKAVPGLRFLWVPDQYASEAERQLIEALDASGLGFGGADVLTLSLLRRRALDASVLIGEAGRRMLLRALLDDAADELLTLPARSYGMPQLLSSAFAQIRQAGGDGVKLAKAAEDGVGGDRWNDLIWLMGAYRRRLDGRFWDDEEADRRLIEALPTMGDLVGARVWIDRFDSIPARMARLIAAVAKCAREVTVVLNYRADGADAADAELYRAMEPSLEALSSAAREAGVPLEYAPSADPAATREEGRAPELAHLTAHLHAYPRRPWEGEAPAICLSCAPTPAAEATAAAEAVLDLAERPGWRLRDIAIIIADLETYAPLLEHALARRGIPYFIDRRRSSLAHPAVRALLAACEAAATGWSPEAMSAYLRSGYSGLEEDAAALLMRAAIERDLRGMRWNRRLTGPWERIEPQRKALMGLLLRLYRALRGARTMAEALAAVYAHLLAVDAPGRLQRDVAALHREGRPVDALETAQIWSVLIDILDQAHALMGDDQCDARRLFRVLETGFSAAEIAVIPPTLDEVLISTPNRVKTPPVRALFLLGANAGVLLTPSPPGLLSADELESCRRSGLRLPGPRDGDDLAKLRLHSVLAAAGNRIAVSYAQTGEDGAPLRPAPLVAALRRTFPRVREVLLPSEADTRLKPLSPILLTDDHAAALMPRRIAVTGLERYAACPAQFFLRDILRPHRPVAAFPSLPDTGTVLHSLAERWMADLMDNGPDPAILTREEHAAMAEKAIASVLEGERNRPGWDEGRMRYWRRRIAHLAEDTLWAAAGHLAAGDFRPAALERRFLDDSLGAAALSGTIDRMDRAGNLLRIVDYKSGAAATPRPPSLAAVYHGLSLQLPLYASAVSRTGIRGDVVGMYHLALRDRLMREEDAARAGSTLHLLGWTLGREDILRALDRDAGGTVVALAGKAEETHVKEAIDDPAIWDAVLGIARGHAQRYIAGLRVGQYAPAPRALDDGSGSPCDRCAARAACDAPREALRRMESLRHAEAIERIARASARSEISPR